MEPISEWEGKDLTSVFLQNECCDHKPRGTTGKVLLNKMGNVMTVQESESLPSIFKKLSTEGFLSAPVITGEDQLVGEITLLDLVKHVNSLFFATAEEDWVAWFQKKLEFQTTEAGAIMREPSMYYRNPFQTMDEHFTSFSALECMAREKRHQIMLVDGEKRLSGILTQSMLISFLRQNKQKWGSEFMRLKVKDFKGVQVEDRKLQTVNEDETTINAFLKMEEQNVHGLPIVDHRGVLTGVISVRDLRGVGDDGAKFFRLFRKVRDFKKLVCEEHKALAPSTHYSKAATPLLAAYITPDGTMEDVIRKMNDGCLHRLVVVDADSARAGRPVPIGLISQSDVLFQTLDFIVNPEQLAWRERLQPARAERVTGRKVSSKEEFEPKYKEPTEQKSSPGKRTSPGKRSIPIF